MKALRVKAQAIPVAMPTLSVLAASQVAWVTELRKSSGAQTQSIPAASAARRLLGEVLGGVADGGDRDRGRGRPLR